MAHAQNIVYCQGPQDPHAFDLVPLAPRKGDVDIPCPRCRGHGQWNVEIDLVSFRSRRQACPDCYGGGWIETGFDDVQVPDIVMSLQGYPMWTMRIIHRDRPRG